jgi:hypothetical protein
LQIALTKNVSVLEIAESGIKHNRSIKPILARIDMDGNGEYVLIIKS